MGFTGEFAGYRLGEELGRGGMGVVVAATHVASGRPVALKLILALHDPEARARFAREVLAMKKVRHEGIVALLEAGEHEDGTPFLVMERLEGGSLRERLRAGPLPIAEAAALVATVARAVHEAHEAGLVHRDLKPSNVLFDRAGRPKVADFGLVRVLFGAERLTQTGTVLGTPHYLAPEQLGAAPQLDRRADVYALGAILHELLVGEPPFARFAPPTLWDRVLHGAPPSPREQRRDVPPALDAACRRALAKAPAERFSTALDLALALERALRAPAARGRAAFAAIAAALALAVGGTVAAARGLRAPAAEVDPPPPTVAAVVTAAPADGLGGAEPVVDAPEAADPLRALLQAGRFDEALRLAEAASTPGEAAVGRARVLLERGVARGRAGDAGGREADLREAVDALRDRAGLEVSKLRARLFAALELWELSAHALVDVVAAGDPQGEPRAMLLLQALERAVRAAPDVARASFFTIPAAADLLASPDAVLRSVADAAQGTRVAGPANVALARALHARGAAPQVIGEALDRAVAAGPTDAVTWLARSEWHAARGDGAAAQADLRRLNALPGGARSHSLEVFVGALLLAERGQRDDAAGALAGIAYRAPADPIGQAAARRHVELTGRPPPPPPPLSPAPPLAREGEEARLARLGVAFREALRAHEASQPSFFEEPGARSPAPAAAAEFADLAAQVKGTRAEPVIRVALARALFAEGASPERVEEELEAALSAAAGRTVAAVLARAEWSAAHEDVERAQADLVALRGLIPPDDERLAGWFRRVDLYARASAARERGRRAEAIAAYERVVQFVDAERRAGRPHDAAMMVRAARVLVELRRGEAPR